MPLPVLGCGIAHDIASDQDEVVSVRPLEFLPSINVLLRGLYLQELPAGAENIGIKRISTERLDDFR